MELYKGNALEPEWEKTERVHDWRNYISDEVRLMWDSFNHDQRRALARQADAIADSEQWD